MQCQFKIIRHDRTKRAGNREKDSKEEESREWEASQAGKSRRCNGYKVCGEYMTGDSHHLEPSVLLSVPLLSSQIPAASHSHTNAFKMLCKMDGRRGREKGTKKEEVRREFSWRKIRESQGRERERSCCLWIKKIEKDSVPVLLFPSGQTEWTPV